MSYLWRKALAVGGAVAAAALLVPSPASASPSTAFNATFQNFALVNDVTKIDAALGD